VLTFILTLIAADHVLAIPIRKRFARKAVGMFTRGLA
jgi:hypothetical protein